MLASDAIGAVGSIALLEPPARDLWLRYKRQVRQGTGRGPFAALRNALAFDVERERNSLSAVDMLFFGSGGLFLLFSFVLKMLEL